MDVNRSVTNRLIDWIQEASLEKTFTSVADDIGVDEKIVRNIFNDYVVELVKKPWNHLIQDVPWFIRLRMVAFFSLTILKN